MTTNDKTRQKLVDSMRKTKVSATKKTKVAVSKDTSNTPDGNSQTKNANKIKKKMVVKANSHMLVDPYRSRGRIWPD
ncbi:hypothetical protein [Sulfuriflexus mobilis]|uniref:hypothetical protein n=1 Tax=Sulfuriflexus mobilis TaxID=1811807 RepID=UPI000F833408|nr:hypothetical protein [Sulfuriflexus mobilis]